MSAELVVAGLAVLAALAYLIRKLAGSSRGCSGCPYREGCDTVGDRGCPGVPPGFDHSKPEDGDTR